MEQRAGRSPRRRYSKFNRILNLKEIYFGAGRPPPAPRSPEDCEGDVGLRALIPAGGIEAGPEVDDPSQRAKADEPKNTGT